MQYENDIKIDPLSLDVEWLQQPTLMFKYASLEVELMKKEMIEKERLELVKAEIDREIRSNPEKFGISKITENVVSSTILMDERYKEAFKTYTDTLYELKMAKVAVTSISAKKDALENLVKLFGQQYFAGPEAPRRIDKEWERKVKEREINSKIKFGRK